MSEAIGDHVTPPSRERTRPCTVCQPAATVDESAISVCGSVAVNWKHGSADGDPAEYERQMTSVP
jgi:hypothetical protein